MRKRQKQIANDPTSKLYAAIHSKEHREQWKKALKKGAAACRKAIATKINTGNSLTFVSAAEAESKLSEKHNTKFNNSHISKCANKKLNKHKGYAFRFA